MVHNSYTIFDDGLWIVLLQICECETYIKVIQKYKYKFMAFYELIVLICCTYLHGLRNELLIEVIDFNECITSATTLNRT